MSLCLTKHHAVKMFWGGGIAPRILDFGTRRRWVVSSTARPLYPWGRALGTHWIGGWVGTRAVLDAVEKRKTHSPRRESNLRTPIVHPVPSRFTGWATGVQFPAGTGNRFSSLRHRVTESRPTLDISQLPNQRVTGALSTVVKRPGREPDPSPVSRMLIALPLSSHMTSWLGVWERVAMLSSYQRPVGESKW
jgi:hypothetical protein